MGTFILYTFFKFLISPLSFTRWSLTRKSLEAFGIKTSISFSVCLTEAGDANGVTKQKMLGFSFIIFRKCKALYLVYLVKFSYLAMLLIRELTSHHIKISDLNLTTLELLEQHREDLFHRIEWENWFE